MSDPTVSNVEQVAGFAAAKHDITQSVPSMFQGYIHDSMIQRVVYDVLLAGAKARSAHAESPKHLSAVAKQPRVPMKGDAGNVRPDVGSPVPDGSET